MGALRVPESKMRDAWGIDCETVREDNPPVMETIHPMFGTPCSSIWNRSSSVTGHQRSLVGRARSASQDVIELTEVVRECVGVVTDGDESCWAQ